MFVKFTKEICIVFEKDNTTIMSGPRSFDNCYLWNSVVSSDVCNSIRNNEASLSHKRLGHVNLQSVRKVISAEAVLGIPSLSGEGDSVW